MCIDLYTTTCVLVCTEVEVFQGILQPNYISNKQGDSLSLFICCKYYEFAKHANEIQQLKYFRWILQKIKREEAF